MQDRGLQKDSEEYEAEIAKIKVEISNQRTMIISFIKSSEELYEQFEDG